MLAIRDVPPENMIAPTIVTRKKVIITSQSFNHGKEGCKKKNVPV